MDLATYRSKHGLTQAAVADLLVAAGYTTANQSLISQWERGELVISADWCVRLEQVTGGVCRRIDNRPDLFGDVVQINRKHRKAREVELPQVRKNNSG